MDVRLEDYVYSHRKARDARLVTGVEVVWETLAGTGWRTTERKEKPGKDPLLVPLLRGNWRLDAQRHAALVGIFARQPPRPARERRQEAAWKSAAAREKRKRAALKAAEASGSAGGSKGSDSAP